VITDKAIFGFHPETRELMILSVHPGVTLDEVRSTMGFAPLVSDPVPATEPPAAEQLRLIREEIDPDRMYMG